MQESELILEINGRTVIGNAFAYDRCHKIYILEDVEDYKNAIKLGYKICLLRTIEEIYNNSCSLRFISNWKLTEKYVGQFENATFNWVESF